MSVRVEEAIQGVEGVKRITSTSSEGRAQVVVELETSADIARVGDDVKSRVDAIDTFPAETEKPVIREITNPPPGDQRGGLRTGRRDDLEAPRREGAGRDLGPAGHHARRAVERAPLRDLDRGLRGGLEAARHDLRSGRPRGPDVVAGPPRRLGEDRRRRGAPAHQGAGLRRAGLRRPRADDPAQRHPHPPGRRRHGEGRLRGDGPARPLRRGGLGLRRRLPDRGAERARARRLGPRLCRRRRRPHAGGNRAHRLAGPVEDPFGTA